MKNPKLIHRLLTKMADSTLDGSCGLDDEEIEHGADLFELTPEQKKASKAARSVDRKPAAQKAKATRKEDPDKRALMAILAEAFGDMEDYTVSNPERQIDFKFNGRRFRIVLSAPRK